MDEVATEPVGWKVSAHPRGEILAVEAGGPGLRLFYLGAGGPLGADGVAGWLRELAGMVRAALQDATADGVPRVLQQALTGLLFYEEELWPPSPASPPCTLVLVAAGGRIAVGWCGGGRLELTRGGEPFQPVWSIVRDEQGRDARAFLSGADQPLSLRAIWPGEPGGQDVPQGAIEAHWPGLPAPAPDAAADEAPQPVESPVASGIAPEENAGEGAGEDVQLAVEIVQPTTESRPRRFWRFRSWVDRLVGSAPEPIAHDVPGVPDLIPETEETAADVAPELADVAEPAAPEAAAESHDLDLVASAGSWSETEPAHEEPPEAENVAPVLDEGVHPTPIASAIAPEAEVLPEPVPEPVREAEVAAEPVPVREETIADDPMPAIAEAPIAEEPAIAPVPAEPAAAAAAEAPALAEAGARSRPVRRAEWPAPEEGRAMPALPWRRLAIVGAAVLVLFGGGWLLGRTDLARLRGNVAAGLRAVGLGPALFDVTVTSRPAGAWIAVDGVAQSRRTPATLSLKPGSHRIALSLSGEPGAVQVVEGRRGQRLSLDAELWGGLLVTAPDAAGPIEVSLDGQPQGTAPVRLDHLPPGIHRVQFSGPGVIPWEQTVEVHVNRVDELAAQPTIAPPTGVLEVTATLANDSSAEPLSGAAVWIDGASRGATPLRIELPSGPHSVRVRWHEEDGPVQVIDLPGGNVRFASVPLGLDPGTPRLAAQLAPRLPLDRPTVLSASLAPARPGDLQDMWLHARTPEGAWRRYPMTLMRAGEGLVGVCVFPATLFDAHGRTAWYVSAMTPTGDEYFTEIQLAQSAAQP